MTIQDVVNYTDEKLVNWYKEVLLSYGVKGKGKTFYDPKENTITVKYIEDGEAKVWDMAFYPEYLENGVGWVFRCWMELS